MRQPVPACAGHLRLALRFQLLVGVETVFQRFRCLVIGDRAEISSELAWYRMPAFHQLFSCKLRDVDAAPRAVSGRRWPLSNILKAILPVEFNVPFNIIGDFRDTDGNP